MGEDVYTVSGYTKPEYKENESVEWAEYNIQFSSTDDDWRCLCTFPHNDGKTIDVSRMRSLALLGAAVVLAHQGELEETNSFLPFCVPEWIREEISRLLPDKENE